MSTASTALPGSVDARSTQNVVRQLTARLSRTQQRLLHVRWFTAVCSAMAAAVFGLALLAAADDYGELRLGLRAPGLFALVALVLSRLTAVRRRIREETTLGGAAAETEQRVAQFGQRLRTTLDYEQQNPAPAQASQQLLTAMHRQTLKLSRDVEWDDVVRTGPAFAAIGIAAVVIVAWLTALAVSPDYRTATARALLIPAEYTTVSFTPQEQTVKFGDSAEVSVEIAGRPLPAATLRHRPAGSDAEWTIIDLAESEANAAADDASSPSPVLLAGTFGTRFDNLQQDVEFEVLAGPRAASRPNRRQAAAHTGKGDGPHHAAGVHAPWRRDGGIARFEGAGRFARRPAAGSQPPGSRRPVDSTWGTRQQCLCCRAGSLHHCGERARA